MWTLPLVAGVMVTACGSSSSSPSTSSSTIGGSSAAIPSGASGSLAGGSFCDKARSYAKVAIDQSQQLFSGGVGGARSSPQDLAQKFGDLIKQEAPLSQDLANSAPDEIKPDVEYLAKINEKLVQSVNDAHGDFNKISSQFAPLAQDPKFTATTQKLEKYLADKCGITPPPVPSFSPPTGSGRTNGTSP